MTSDKKFEDATPPNAGSMDGTQEAPATANSPDMGTSAAQPPPPFPENEEIIRLKAEAADYKDRLLRTYAEMDNVRKRLEREKTDASKYAISKFARDVVGIGDNVQRAMDAIPQSAAEQDPTVRSFVEGVAMIDRELLAILGRHGVTRLDPKGQPFNPHHHQAVVEVPSADFAAGVITQVFQSGYTLEDRVLRPAMVAVSKGMPKPQPSEPRASSEPTADNDASPQSAGEQPPSQTGPTG